MVKRLLLTGMLCFAPGWGGQVLAHDPPDRGAPTAINISGSAVQAALMVLGFWLAVQIVRDRGRDQRVIGAASGGWRLLPMLAFIGAITAMNLWLMAQDMEMRF